MPRPQRCRKICRKPAVHAFSPENVIPQENVVLSLDEYEVIRLVDTEQQTHEQCAARMEISRSTVTEIYESARRKLADCIVHGKRLVISGGNFRLCEGDASGCRRQHCGEYCGRETIKKEGMSDMKIAVTYENGAIFQHFGHTEQFKVYEVENGAVVKSEVLSTNGSGHGALAGYLLGGGVDVLICGGIGGGAQMALARAGIRLYGGVRGDADAAVQAFLEGKLDYDPNVHCDHHEHEHGHDHQCGDHGCHDHDCGQGCH